jgi:MFS family permease
MTPSLEHERGRWFQNLPAGQFWIFFSAAMLFNLGFSVFFFLFNLYLLGLGRDERSLGLIGSCMAFGSLCGTIPAGLLAQRFGLRTTYIGGITLAVTVCALRVCFVGTSPQLALAVLSGFALCTWAVCLSPAVAALTTPRQRPFAFSLMFASGIGDAGLGSLAAGYLPGWFAHIVRGHSLSATQSERAVLLCGCTIAAFALLPISRIRFANATVSTTRFVVPTGSFLYRYLPAMAAWSLVTGAFPPFASMYFVKHLGLSIPQMSSIFSLSQLIQFVAILAAPILLRRMKLTTGVAATQLLTAIALVSLAAAHTEQHAAWLYWIYMAAQYSNEPGIYSVLMDAVPPDQRSAASSLTFFVSSGVAILSSSIVGISIVHFGYPAVLYTIGLFAVVAAILFRRVAYSISS